MVQERGHGPHCHHRSLHATCCLVSTHRTQQLNNPITHLLRLIQGASTYYGGPSRAGMS